MSDLEKPLCLRLLWGGGDIRHSFSLQENETGDIVVSEIQFPFYTSTLFVTVLKVTVPVLIKIYHILIIVMTISNKYSKNRIKILIRMVIVTKLVTMGILTIFTGVMVS